MKLREALLNLRVGDKYCLDSTSYRLEVRKVSNKNQYYVKFWSKIDPSCSSKIMKNEEICRIRGVENE